MRKFFLAFALVPLLLWGCATYTPPDLSGYFWPPPPAKKRVQLLNVIRTDVDVRGTGGMENIFGAVAGFAFKKPHGVAVDNRGNVYVSDTILKTVFVLNLEEKSVKELSHPRGWGMPLGVAADAENGLLAVANSSRVDLFDLETSSFKSTIGGFNRPAGLAFDPERQVLYIADTGESIVYAYGYDGKMISKVAEPGGQQGKVFMPIGLDVDSRGRLFVVDSMNWRVQIYNPDGTLEKSFGKHGDAPGNFARPKDVAISKDDFVLVTDAAYGNFQIFDASGRVYLYVGTNGKSLGEFHTPQGIAVDGQDRVYAVDQTNRRLQVFQLMTDRYYAEHPETEAAPEGEAQKP